MPLRDLTFRAKDLLLKLRYPKVQVAGSVKILGEFPHFKLPRDGRVQLGDKVVLNSDFKNSNTALTYRCKFVTGYSGVISIGDRTMLNGSCLVAYDRITIGKDCQIASSTLISDTDFHPVDAHEREKQVRGLPYSFDSVAKASITLGDNVWIGWNATILKGVTIGKDSIVAAGSVVLAGNYPEGSLLAGNPARVAKTFPSRGPVLP